MLVFAARLRPNVVRRGSTRVMGQWQAIQRAIFPMDYRSTQTRATAATGLLGCEKSQAGKTVGVPDGNRLNGTGRFSAGRLAGGGVISTGMETTGCL